MKLVLDVNGLAEALCLAPATVKDYAHKYPEKLPRRLLTPTKKLLWAIKDVEEWVESMRASSSLAHSQ